MPFTGQLKALDNSCDRFSVESGPVFVQYRHKGESLTIKVAQGQIATAMGHRRQDPCDELRAKCLQVMDEQRRAGKAGKGFDGTGAADARRGSPCEMGLPCGSVLPPQGDWVVRLQQAAFNGTWRVTASRGGGTDFEIPISKGLARLQQPRLVPGASYRYVLLDERGSPVASGDFSVGSPNSVRDVADSEAEHVRAGLPARAARYRALADNDFDWDAVQLARDVPAEGEAR
ncbi:hypothetical protein [Aquabacterium sp. OR-4]|uniref:hypothetical protein n=1 Tax=Aquabacterium sp. OR-4 TaxID=2978127 RepID=UPI0028C58D8E|nr:hypothetical protein [Aquabacterium sp. OR-4]MDT7838754.1 hypothetical protein [Aquabacterium sp. OR-4]